MNNDNISGKELDIFYKILSKNPSKDNICKCLSQAYSLGFDDGSDTVISKLYLLDS